MDLKRCKYNHYYDGERYSTCPHCKKKDKEPEPTEDNDSNLTKPADLSDESDIVQREFDAERQDSSRPAKLLDDGHTVGAFGETDPVVGWLVCIEGADKGESFNLKAGMNYVGRALDMDIALLRDSSVSKKKHVIIIYDKKNIDYIIHMGESKNVVYVNGELLLEPRHLQLYDRILIGKSELMFVPFCSEQFAWEE